MLPALKEWDCVCEALGCGRQVIVLRKGGIAEGKRGFEFLHNEFVLLPTFFHQQSERVLSEYASAIRQEPAEREAVEIRYTASLVWQRDVRDPRLLAKLQTYHILSHDEVLARYAANDQPGIQIALLRIYRFDPPFVVAWNKSFAGCRSWAEIAGDLESQTLVSVLSDERFAEIDAELRRILD